MGSSDASWEASLSSATELPWASKELTGNDMIVMSHIFMTDDDKMTKLEVLYLSMNQIGNTGLEALSTAFGNGAMAQLQVHSVPTALSPDSEI